ncbi:MAG TPA: transglycosylase domain-containing protein [Baekduia sp.]|nr:transglycosylase domain-containing protein [Baekduia sp.]
MTRRERMQRKRRNRGGPAQKAFIGFGVLSTVLIVAAIGAVTYVVAVATGGPSLASLKPQPQGATSTVYDADGKRLGFIKAEVLRTPVADSEIPDVVRDATVAIEDRRFYQHKGVDFEGVVRAAFRNATSGGTVEGGSTLTMQLIRNLYTGDRERSFERKLREARLAEELENEHPGRKGKLWILNRYINNVFYGTSGGQNAYGIQAAARIFFNKPAKELTLPEAALLAGLPQAPTDYNPNTNAPGAKVRRDKVIRAMRDEKMITAEQADAAIAAPLGTQVGEYYRQRTEGYFFDYVQSQLAEEYGEETLRRGGLKVYTTLDRKLQRAARAAINPAVAGLDREAAVVSVDPRNGYIRAMASSGKYGDFKFNLAAQGKYAAGSTFKTMVLMEALRRGVDPDTTSYVSKPLKFDDPVWGPIDVKTYSGSYIGRANIFRATLSSDNSIYQQLDLDLGPKEVARTARRMGIRSKLKGYPAEGLGGLTDGVSPLEMANAYATIASYGIRNRVTAITRVCRPKSVTDDEELVCEDHETKRKRVFTDGVAAEATKILKANMTSGTGTRAQIGCPAAGKTGTVDDFTDAWFVGYTPHLSTSVWVGHANARYSLGEGQAGGTTAAPIWGAYMKVAKGSFCGDWPAPEDPFTPVPFDGKYAKEGAPGADPTAPVQPTSTTKAPDGNGGKTAPEDPAETPPVTPTPTPPAETPPPEGGVAPPA